MRHFTWKLELGSDILWVIVDVFSILMFLKKGLGLVSPPYFVDDFSRKVFLMLCSINWPNFFVWMPLFFEISDNMCVAIVCYPVCDIINFEIYVSITSQKIKFYIKDFFSKCDQIRSFQSAVIFSEEILNGKLHVLCSVLLSKGFPTWLKRQNKSLNISKTKRTFKIKQKAFFIISNWLSVFKSCLRHECVFKESAELFNFLFAKQSSLIKSDNKFPPRLHFKM